MEPDHESADTVDVLDQYRARPPDDDGRSRGQQSERPVSGCPSSRFAQRNHVADVGGGSALQHLEPRRLDGVEALVLLDRRARRRPSRESRSTPSRNGTRRRRRPSPPVASRAGQGRRRTSATGRAASPCGRSSSQWVMPTRQLCCSAPGEMPVHLREHLPPARHVDEHRRHVCGQRSDVVVGEHAVVVAHGCDEVGVALRRQADHVDAVSRRQQMGQAERRLARRAGEHDRPAPNMPLSSSQSSIKNDVTNSGRRMAYSARATVRSRRCRRRAGTGCRPAATGHDGAWRRRNRASETRVRRDDEM